MNYPILKHIFRLFLFIFLLTQLSNAVQIANDTFDTNLDGWSGSGVSHHTSSDTMRINRDSTASKQYNFGPTYINQTATVTFKLTIDGGWETSGTYQDFFRIYVNGTNIQNNTYSDGIYNLTFTAPIDSSGNLLLAFTSDTTGSNEYSFIDNVVINATPVITDLGNLRLTNIGTASPNPASIGESVTFDVRANNLGPDHVQGNIDISTTYNQDVTIVSATQTAGGGFSCLPNSGVLPAGTPIICQKTNQMNNGAPNKDMRFIVQASSQGTLTQSSTIASTTTGDPDNTNNTATASVSVNAPSPTVWVPNANYTSATLSPSPYANDSDDSELLTIPGASELTVTITGTLEYHPNCIYDYITITPSGGTNYYCGNINHTFTVPGDTITLNFHSDYSVTNTGATVTIEAIAQTPPIMHAIPLQTITRGTVGHTIQLSDYVTLTNGDPILSYTLGGDSLPTGMSYDATSGVIGGTPTVVGEHNLTAYATDDDGHSNIVTLTINITPENRLEQGSRDFSLRYQSSHAGDVVTIGNTILVAPTNQNADCNAFVNSSASTHTGYLSNAPDSNRDYNLCAYYSDRSASFPTTTADLTLPHTTERIVWAGLYWQSLVSTPNDFANMTIQIKHENDTDYTEISYDRVDWDHTPTTPSNHDSYAAFKDITNLFIDNDWGSGTFTVGDIPTTEGKVGSLGAYGAWSLVVVYADQNQSIKNFSIYDGWVSIGDTSLDIDSKTINISGFQAPRFVSAEKPIKASVSVFAAEGDKHISRDYLSAKPSLEASYTTLAYNSDQTFDSRIQTPNNFTRDPNPTNNQGIDIQTFNLGTTGEDIIQVNETSIDLQVSSEKYTSGGSISMDQYWPSMIAFSADLLVPKLCYDYTVQKNAFTISSKDREINSFESGTLSIGIAIRSMEGDFDLTNASVKVDLTPSVDVQFKDASYSPNTTNILIPAVYMGNVITEPRIAIGENATQYGGTIVTNQRYFTQFNYQQDDPNFVGSFDFDLNTSIDFGSGPVEYIYSTALGTMEQCPLSEIYSPVWADFNVERSDVTDTTDINSKYTLYTQIVGRDFDLSVAAYDAQGTTAFTDPLEVSGVTLDIEVLNVKPYGEQEFKCSNTNAGDILALPTANGSRGSFFVTFPRDQNNSRIALTDTDDLILTEAMQSTAFRMWVLVDENDTIIRHECAQPTADNPNDQCFIDNVAPHLTDPTNLCPSSSCSSYVSARKFGEQGCYACYRDFFAKPTCSRDNFSIRPESYRLTLSDNDENSSNTPQTIHQNNDIIPKSLASEYDYLLNGQATAYQSEDRALTYVFTVDANLSFQGSQSCPAPEDLTKAFIFNDGNLSYIGENGTTPILTHNNVGPYDLRLLDTLWTKVDQSGFYDTKGNPLKTFPYVDDCIKNNYTSSLNGNIKTGCNISSDFDSTHTKLSLDFKPYDLDMSSTTLTKVPNNNHKIYMNDLNAELGATDTVPMAASLGLTVSAKGKKGDAVLSNFSAGCEAEEVEIWVDRNVSYEGTSELTSIPSLESNIIDVQSVLENATDGNKSIATNLTDSLIVAPTEFDATATATAQMYFNIKRFNNEPVNPVDINFTKLRAESNDSSSYVHLSNAWIPKEDFNLSQTSTFYYARAKSSQKNDFYNNITSSSIQTPVLLQIFCALGQTACNDHQLTTSTSDSDWWMSTAHDQTDGDGDVTLTPSSSVTQPSIVSDGKDESVVVTAPSTARPLVVDVQLTGTSPWLVYNPNSPTLDPDPFYRVRFIGNDSGWTGSGKTGHVVDTNASKKTNNRLGW